MIQFNLLIGTRNVYFAFVFTAILLLPRIGQCFYNPGTGRWLSRDPVGEKASANLYGFINNSTLGRVDPFGLVTWQETWRGPGIFFEFGITDLGKRGPSATATGETEAHWDVNVYRMPCRYFAPCKAEVHARGSADIQDRWSISGPNNHDSTGHELQHVSIYKVAYSEAFNKISTLTGFCMPDEKAKCYVRLGKAIWAAEDAFADYSNDLYDCTLGNYNACEKVPQEDQKWVNLSSEVIRIALECQTVQ